MSSALAEDFSRWPCQVYRANASAGVLHNPFVRSPAGALKRVGLSCTGESCAPSQTRKFPRNAGILIRGKTGFAELGPPEGWDGSIPVVWRPILCQLAERASVERAVSRQPLRGAWREPIVHLWECHRGIRRGVQKSLALDRRGQGSLPD